MAARRKLLLDEAQRITLEQMRDHHPKPYLRQRAAAFLKIAAGESPNQVAQHGLHKAIEVDQIYTWLDRYAAYGLCGLYIRPGRTQSGLFPPLSPSETAARLRDTLAQSPRNFNLEITRWTLAALLHVCRNWLRMVTLVGLWRILQRFGIRYKRGRLAIYSPDLSYGRKRQRIAEIEARVRAEPKRFVLLYLDEFTYTRQPTRANAYAPQGHCQMMVRLGYRQNYEYRILAAVNALTGQVHFLQRNRIRVATLRDFWRHLRQVYSAAEQIYVVVHNWPVHYHPDGLAVLQAQPLAADFVVPPTWPSQPRPAVLRDCLPIVLLPLPTYASSLNPIEKLWRWLRQTVLHLHPFADDSDALKVAVAVFLHRFANGSPSLLRYIGLLPD